MIYTAGDIKAVQTVSDGVLQVDFKRGHSAFVDLDRDAVVPGTSISISELKGHLESELGELVQSLKAQVQ